jgi:hypothetical protein
MGLFDLLESGGGVVQSLIPAGLSKRAVLANERFGKPMGALDKLMNVPALDTQLALIDGIGLGRNGANETAVQNLKTKTAAATAVSTGGQNGFIVHAKLLKISVIVKLLLVVQLFCGGETAQFALFRI